MNTKFKKGQYVSSFVPGKSHLGIIVGEIVSVHEGVRGDSEYTTGNYYTVHFDMLNDSYIIHERELKSSSAILWKTLAILAIILGLLTLLSNIK